MKRPSFQFYPQDWTGNSNLRRCSHAEKGVWVDVLCVLHDQEEYGLVRWPLKELAQAACCSITTIRGLVSKGVLKGDDKRLAQPFIYTPRSGRKDGDPVTLVAIQDGPIWYSSRMVKDEYIRANAGASTRFGSQDGPKTTSDPTDKTTDRARLRKRVFEKASGFCTHCHEKLGSDWEIDHFIPRSKGGRHIFDNLVASCRACNHDKSDTFPDDWTPPRHSPSRRHGEDIGEHKGDGSSTSSSSSPSGNSEPIGSGDGPPKPPRLTDPGEIIFGYGVPMLTTAGTPEKQARSFLGGLRKTHGDTLLIDKLRECAKAKPLQPLEWLAAALPPSGAAQKMNQQEALEAANRAIGERFLAGRRAADATA